MALSSPSKCLSQNLLWHRPLACESTPARRRCHSSRIGSNCRGAGNPCRPARRPALIPGAVIALVGLSAAVAVAQAPAGDRFREDVLKQLKQRPVGRYTVEVLDLPDDLLRRIANRHIRALYQNRFRMVLKDDSGTTSTPEAPPPSAAQPSPTSPSGIVKAAGWPAILGGAALMTLAAAAVVVLLRRKGQNR